MIVRLDPTGTHIKDNRQKVKFAFYPAVTDKSYRMSKDPVPVPLPALYHFITVPETFVLTDLEAYLSNMAKQSWATLDDICAKTLYDKVHMISPYMRSKVPFSTSLVATKQIADLLLSTNQKLNTLALELTASGTVEKVVPQTIDIGTSAANNATITTALDFDANNSANADGTIDTAVVQVGTSLTGVTAGVAYIVSGSNLTSRDHESIGNMADNTPVTGLTISCVTGDFAGLEWDTGNMGYINNSGTGYYVSARADFPFTNRSFTLASPRSLNIYMTGTEAGGAVFCPYYYLNANAKGAF